MSSFKVIVIVFVFAGCQLSKIWCSIIFPSKSKCVITLFDEASRLLRTKDLPSFCHLLGHLSFSLQKAKSSLANIATFPASLIHNLTAEDFNCIRHDSCYQLMRSLVLDSASTKYTHLPNFTNHSPNVSYNFLL